jgi:hypothetical protein
MTADGSSANHCSRRSTWRRQSADLAASAPEDLIGKPRIDVDDGAGQE